MRIDRRCRPFCNRKGEHNPNYKGEKVWKLKQWRLSIYKKDNRVCQKCGKKNLKGHDLHAHHKKDKNQFPELIYDVENGETLCSSCHMSFHKKGRILTEETKKKISEAHKGKAHSEETKKKIKIAVTGVNNPNYGHRYSWTKEQKENKIAWNKGSTKQQDSRLIRSESCRNKISETMKKIFQERYYNG